MLSAGIYWRLVWIILEDNKIRSDVNRINSSLNFFSNRVCSLWNSLPRSTTSLKSFIKRISSWNILFQQLFSMGLLCLCHVISSLDIRRCHYLNIGSGTYMFLYNLRPSIKLWVCLTSILIWFLHWWFICGMCNIIILN